MSIFDDGIAQWRRSLSYGDQAKRWNIFRNACDDVSTWKWPSRKDAISALQALAEEAGIVDAVGQDEVHTLFADVFTEAASKQSIRGNGHDHQGAEQHAEALPETPWPTLNPAALHGLAGEIVRAIEPHTESDPVAILLQTLTYFGNVIGKGPFYQVEGDHHHTNLFITLVGESSKSRKGTSAGRVTQVIEIADLEWVKFRRVSGLSSGEGLIWAVRDPIYKTAKDGSEECVDTGIDDKRLLADEREFAQALTVMQREGNTLSRVMRDCWDGAPVIASLTKHSPVQGDQRSHIGHRPHNRDRAAPAARPHQHGEWMG